ncbi:MAG: type IX secretion system membrane protein PorP/SprF [Imperialibacter sp.]|uniref:PorP/SprF family type IX secretion system membrane protein n=1 Tax=Imperialibacter sp. TaxID=2038411 RepID=UPI0032EE09BB
MNRIKALIKVMIAVATTAPCFSVNAQQQAMFTQYMFNGLALNPAYAGSHEALSATAIARVQWVGLDGAPNTQSVSMHTPVPDKNIGVGLLFLRDKIGVTSQNSLFLSYAYRIKMRRSTLSFGLQGGFNDYSHNLNDLGIGDDGYLAGNIKSFKPNVGTGIYFNSKRLYVGASLPLIFNSAKDDRVTSFIYSEIKRHYFVTAGYVFDLNRSLKFKPNLLVKAVEGAPVELDVNANLLVNDVLWVGLSYRSFESIDVLLELQLNGQFRVGYSYDILTNDLGRVNSGSHELMLNYIFQYSKSRIVTPRYF